MSRYFFTSVIQILKSTFRIIPTILRCLRIVTSYLLVIYGIRRFMDNRENFFDMLKYLPQLSWILTSMCKLWRVINRCRRVINECLRLTTSLRYVRICKKNPWVWRGYKPETFKSTRTFPEIEQIQVYVNNFPKWLVLTMKVDQMHIHMGNV
jgi:hypothetical protein